MDNLSVKKFPGRLIIVTYRLPFKIIRHEDTIEIIQNSGGLVSAVLSLARSTSNTFFDTREKIQWIGVADNDSLQFDQMEFETDEFVVHPITLEQHLHENYYEGFCNNLIWPLCHYFPSLARFEDDYFEAYQEAHEHFFSKIKQVSRPDDVFWIHDYQLMLLPAMLRRWSPAQKIGFFFHIPFPSFELFRLLPKDWRKALVDGILGADLVGFHTNDYVEYFLKTVWLVSGLNNKLHHISIENRVVKVGAFPISIDFRKFSEAFSDPEVILARSEIRRSLATTRIIFSVDRLDYSKGIIHRLRGYRLFLENSPQWRELVSLVMVVVPSRDTIEQYQQMKSEIDQFVGMINADFGSLMWQPVIYQYRSMTYTELLGMYTASDVALVTPARDGMNLVSKEYVASRVDNKGVLILSEMAGAAAELGEALIINPLDLRNTAGAIITALEMPGPEQTKRMELMRQRIKEYDVFAWAEDFFEQMLFQKSIRTKPNQIYLDSQLLESIRTSYERSANRILLFDFDGTLVPIIDDPANVRIPLKTKELIRDIATRNPVVIVSGRDRYFLENQFDQIPLDLIAEHGAMIRKSGDTIWKISQRADEKWKQAILPILQTFTQRCPGTFVEEKETSLAWHYRKVEDELLAIQRAQELLWQLKSFLKNEFNLQLIDGNKVLEIKKADYNKGTAVRKYLENESYDFVLAIGDDTTDEDMFAVLPDSAYTIKVGETPSAARFYIKSQIEVEHLLKVLTASISRNETVV